jgi:predicted GNAT family acetyltransferase
MSDRASVEVRDNPDKQQFEAYVDGKPAGSSAYDLTDAGLLILHTEVDDAHEGQGVGSALVRQMLDQLREREGLQVTASCPFVRAWMHKHPDYQDLTHRGAR